MILKSMSDHGNEPNGTRKSGALRLYIVDLPVAVIVSQNHSTKVFLGGGSPVPGYLRTNQWLLTDWSTFIYPFSSLSKPFPLPVARAGAFQGRTKLESHLHKWHISSVRAIKVNISQGAADRNIHDVIVAVVPFLHCVTGTGFESGCVESCSISPSCPLVLVLGDVFGLLFGPERTK